MELPDQSYTARCYSVLRWTTSTVVSSHTGISKMCLGRLVVGKQALSATTAARVYASSIRRSAICARKSSVRRVCVSIWTCTQSHPRQTIAPLTRKKPLNSRIFKGQGSSVAKINSMVLQLQSEHKHLWDSPSRTEHALKVLRGANGKPSWIQYGGRRRTGKVIPPMQKLCRICTDCRGVLNIERV
jgi:hypothetical protein